MKHDSVDGTRVPARIAARAIELFAQYERDLRSNTDRFFCALLALQGVAGVVAALVITPRSWAGSTSHVHPHVWAAVSMGLALTLCPIALAVFRPGRALTRHLAAASQAVFSALFIHLTAGRIETHFHVFGSLAILAAYRDWRVLVTYSGVVAFDHFFRGVWWPQSVFGTATASTWRWAEHAGWVVFEDVFLIASMGISRREMRRLALQRARLEDAHAGVEAEVEQRTRALRLSEQRNSALISHAPVGIFETDSEGRCVFVNPRWVECTGVSAQTALGRPWAQAVAAEEREDLERAWRGFVSGREGAAFDAECGIRRPDGAPGFLGLRLAPMRDESGEPTGYLGTVTDMTERRLMEQSLRQDAHFDRLTGLPNRTLLRLRLEDAVTRLRGPEAAGFALLFMDFNRFKAINDTLGHAAGDEFLRSAAARIVGAARARRDLAPEGAVVARLGGDEFVALLLGVRESRSALEFAHALRETLARPHTIAGSEVTCPASIGVAMGSAEHATADDALRDADVAMYRGKREPEGAVTLFDRAMREAMLSRNRLERDLRRAIDAGQFELVYQPIVSLETGRAAGFEALLRWRHPTLGLMLPGSFLQIAEETGLIVAMGRWALRRACEEAETWPEGPDGERLFVAVNLSRRHVENPSLHADVEAALGASGLDPRRLEVEITENTIMRNIDASVATLGGLRDRGVRVSMDDFGTGHSSLACLRRLPLDTLKIDRSFVQVVTPQRSALAILEAITTLAHNLRMRVVAEGVERAEDLPQLLALECEMAQGLYFAPPLAPEDARAWLRSPPSWAAPRSAAA